MSNGLSYGVRDQVATITIDRPQNRNSLAPEVVAGIVDMVRAGDRDPAVKCLLIQATGDNFTVGGDIKGFLGQLDQPPEERYDLFERRMLVGNRLPAALLEASKPVVIATRGSVAGAGVAMCLAADFVIASDTSFFLLAHVLIGLSLDCGLSGLIVPAMGVKAAKRLALLGERVGAEEAAELGIVTKVVADTVLETETATLTSRLARGPLTAMRISKALLNHAAYRDFSQQLALEAKGVAECAGTEDFRAGIESILQKKKPRFQ